jgi:hypothetical protein
MFLCAVLATIFEGATAVRFAYRIAIMEADVTDKKKPDKPALYIIEGGPDAKQSKTKAPKQRRLTAKQERFVSEVIKGATASDAYRAAYDVDRGKGMKASAIWSESSRLMGNPLVASRLQTARASIERSAVSSALSRRRWIVERLTAESQDMTDGTSSSRVRALEMLGRDSEVAMWRDEVSIQTSEASAETVRAELEAKLTALLQPGSGQG